MSKTVKMSKKCLKKCQKCQKCQKIKNVRKKSQKQGKNRKKWEKNKVKKKSTDWWSVFAPQPCARIPAWIGILVLCHRAVWSSHPRPPVVTAVGVLPGPTGAMTHPDRMMSHQSANSVRAWVGSCRDGVVEIWSWSREIGDLGADGGEMSAPPLEWADWSAQSSRTNSWALIFTQSAMSQSILMTLIQICFNSIICFRSTSSGLIDIECCLRLPLDFVWLEVSFGNFSMKFFFQPILINMLFGSFKISSKPLMQYAAISSITGMSLEKSTLLSLRCNEINFRLESEFLSVSVDRRSSSIVHMDVPVYSRSPAPKIGSSELPWRAPSRRHRSAIRSFRGWPGVPRSCSSGVGEVRALCVEDRVKLCVQFSRAGWVSFASALDSSFLQLALHAVLLDTEVIFESVWSQSSSSNWLSPLSLLQSRTRGSRLYYRTVCFPLASATCLLLRVSRRIQHNHGNHFLFHTLWNEIWESEGTWLQLQVDEIWKGEPQRCISSSKETDTHVRMLV